MEKMDNETTLVTAVKSSPHKSSLPIDVSPIKRSATEGQESLEDRRRNWKKRRPRRKNIRKPRTTGPKNHGNGRKRLNSEWDGEKTPVQSSPLNLDQEQEKRANWVKVRMLRYGKPYAPYNTTQYLMEDQKTRDPEIGEIGRSFSVSHAEGESLPLPGLKKQRTESFSTRDGSESDEFYSSPDDEQDFQRRQFSEIYETVHAERISNMSKSDLVQEFLSLEEKAEKLEKKLNDAQTALNDLKSRTQVLSEKSSGKVHVLPMSPSSSPIMSCDKDDELCRLRAEVNRLLEENQRLKDSARHSLPSSQESQDGNIVPQNDDAVTSSFSESTSLSQRPQAADLQMINPSISTPDHNQEPLSIPF
jgi:hypothetical protein